MVSEVAAKAVNSRSVRHFYADKYPYHEEYWTENNESDKRHNAIEKIFFFHYLPCIFNPTTLNIPINDPQPYERCSVRNDMSR